MAEAPSWFASSEVSHTLLPALSHEHLVRSQMTKERMPEFMHHRRELDVWRMIAIPCIR